MTMRRSIEGLTGFGDHDLAEKQVGIRAEFQRRHPGIGDFSLKGRLTQVAGVQNRETILSPLSAETQKFVERMKHDGYAVYQTTGRTPESLKSDGMRYWSLNDKLANITAPPALLAFKRAPSEFFLPGSENIAHDEQIELLLEEQAKIDKKYSGMGLIVREGKLPEWPELGWKHFKKTGVRIFGSDYGYNYTWTNTYESEKRGASRASFGFWVETSGADAGLWDPGSVYPDLRLASLVEIPLK